MKEENAIFAARLMALPPADVLIEMEREAEKAKGHLFHDGIDEECQHQLIQRNEPLIDLAVARYGNAREVVADLYSRGATSEPGRPSIYWTGLRAACLANQVVGSIFSKGPTNVLTENQLRHLILEDEQWGVLRAFLRNPELDENQIANLYKRAGVYAELPDQRWLHMISISADNPRLVKCEDSPEGPDISYWEIEKGFLELLRIAPVSKASHFALDYLFENLNPELIRGAEIEDILERWDALDLRDYKGEVEPGYYTELTLKDEFRCLIGCLYGRQYVGGTYKVVGTAESNDVALRCSYYAHTDLTLAQMQQAEQKDKSAFIFAALFRNDNLVKKEKRAFLESKIMNRELTRRYRRRCEELHQKYKWFNPKPTAEWLIDEDSENDATPEWATSLNAKVSEISKGLASQGRTVQWGLIILAALILLRLHF